MTEIFLLQTANENLLLGYLPEPVGLLLFGLLLIFIPMFFRHFFENAAEQNSYENNPDTRN